LFVGIRVVVGLFVGFRVVGLLVGIRVVGLFVSFRVGFAVVWRFRDFILASVICTVAVAEAHPFCGCQVHSPVPVGHEFLVVKYAQPLV
jgi:hypothetical protein